ncbi:acyl-CoA dehydrogenase [Pedobacter antarcticus]|uniref:acyl-CoA dehydrogenase n=1 Tax=Pedobacter antarcticus TaxID=34086 RepID=UPI002931213C|nr:acyl-CoA dehydrogenase [Pedobacter antarcticus]
MFNLLSTEEKDCIHQYAALSEEQGKLHPVILELAYSKQWFKLFVPASYGGPQLLLPEILRLEEALAAEDGSLAWTVTLCSGAGWFAGFLDPELAADVFSDPEVCFAGSGAIGGTAVESEAGYTINGYWKYASGALHATVFTANCQLLDHNNNPLKDDAGNQVIRSFILKKDEVELVPGWSYFGLAATGSHAFEVKDLQVPANRTFQINENIKLNSPGFDYPFLQMAETTLAVNSAGMTAHFLTLAAESFSSRSGLKRYTDDQVKFFEKELSSCTKALQEARTNFYTTFDASWAQLTEENNIDQELLDAVSLSSRKLAHIARQITDTLYPYCGLEAARKETEINRVWRDIHTASQHSLLTFIS